MLIRSACAEDAVEIAGIWNPAIRESFHTFNDREWTLPEIRDLIAARQAAGYGFLVAVKDEEIAGFATYAPFRAGPGYRFTMENTIYLAQQARGHGAGRAIMGALEEMRASVGCGR